MGSRLFIFICFIFLHHSAGSYHHNVSSLSISPLSVEGNKVENDNKSFTVLPFFIKLHKVASSTTASLFNCVSVEHREAYRGMLDIYDKCGIKHTAWSHMNMNELELYGMPYFAECMLGNPHKTVQIVTILRNPADRFVSAIRYFDKIRKKTNLVRRVMTKSKQVTLEEFRNLTYDIFTPSPEVHPEVRLHEYVDVFASLASTNKYTFDPNNHHGHIQRNGEQGKRNAKLENADVYYQRYDPLLLPGQHAVDTAKEMLGLHFLVGITEDMQGFIALLSVEFNWPPSILCLPYPCQLKAGGANYNCATAGAYLSKLAPHIVEEINRLVAPDLLVYEHARRLFQDRMLKHGEVYEERKKEMSSESYGMYCDELRPKIQSTCKQM